MLGQLTSMKGRMRATPYKLLLSPAHAQDLAQVILLISPNSPLR